MRVFVFASLFKVFSTKLLIHGQFLYVEYLAFQTGKPHVLELHFEGGSFDALGGDPLTDFLRRLFEVHLDILLS